MNQEPVASLTQHCFGAAGHNQAGAGDGIRLRGEHGGCLRNRLRGSLIRATHIGQEKPEEQESRRHQQNRNQHRQKNDHQRIAATAPFLILLFLVIKGGSLPG